MTTLTNAQSTPARSQAAYRDNVYFQDGLGLTAVLTTLLYLILAASLDAAGYVQNMTLLIPVTLGALALGFLMSFSRFDGFFALSHSMFTGLAWILYLMSGLVSQEEIAPFVSNGIPEVQAKAYFVLLRWLNWIDAAINDIASNDNYIFIFEMSFLVWWLTYLGVWSIFRYGYTWRAIIPAGLVLLVNTYYAPESIVGFLVVFCLLAMLIFVRTNLAEQQLRWRDQRVLYSSDVTFDFLRNGIAYSIAVVALAWIVPGFGRSVEVRTVMAPLNQRWEETTQRMNRLYQGLNRQTRPTSSSFGRTLSLGGARNVGESLVFTVSATEGRYWRAVVYDTFTGQQWLSTGEEEIELAANEAVPAPLVELRTPVTQTVSLHTPSGLIFAAPDIMTVDLPTEAMVRELPLATADGEPAFEITMARPQQMLEAEARYTVVSAKTRVTERALNEASTDYPQSIAEQYLQLPDDVSQRVLEDARTITADRPTVYAKARAVETYLRGITYNDNIEAPPPGRDPVEYFLYDIREGYCDYYATAMVVMLRGLGIPARVVSGYAEGAYDPDTALYYISERDAHTWVEVFFPGLGWVEFEPTAGESQLNRPSGNDEINPEGMDGLYDETATDPMLEDELMQDELPAQGMNEQMPEDVSAFESAAGTIADTPWWMWALVTPMLLVGGLWFIWRTRINGPIGFDPDLPPIIFDRLQNWAARLGLGGSPSETPYEQAHSLSTALPEGQQPITSITEQYVQYRFRRRLAGNVRYSASETNDVLTQEWQTLQPLLWRRWLRKLTRLGDKPAPPKQPKAPDPHYELRPSNGYEPE